MRSPGTCACVAPAVRTLMPSRVLGAATARSMRVWAFVVVGGSHLASTMWGKARLRWTSMPSHPRAEEP
jgi:hypothetical protein